MQKNTINLDNLINLTMAQIRIYNLAWRMYQIGYYTMADFTKFLEANNINNF